MSSPPNSPLLGGPQPRSIKFSTGCWPKMGTQPSTIPFLFIGQVVFMGVIMSEAGRDDPLSRSQQIVVWAMIACLALWGTLSGVLAVRKVFSLSGFLNSYPGVWMPLVPLVIIMTFFVTSDSFRTTMEILVANVDGKWFVFIHGWRAFAVGSVIKASQGTFPRLFGLIVGTLDMLFGISAWILFIAMCTGSSVSTSAMLSWHILGVVVIVPGAPIMMQLSLPGLFHANESNPPMGSIFEFPMVLGPSLVVPSFVALNMLMLWQLGKDL